MAPARAFRAPEEPLSVFQESEVVLQVDESEFPFGQNRPHSSCADVGREQLQNGLVSVETPQQYLTAVR